MRPNIEGGSMSGVAPIAAAAGAATPSVPVLFRFELAAGANADNDITLTFPIRVIDAWLQLNGAGVASSVMTVKNSANAISAAMATTGADQAVVRNTTLNDANADIPAGGVLRATSSGGASQPAQTVFVLAIRLG